MYITQPTNNIASQGASKLEDGISPVVPLALSADPVAFKTPCNRASTISDVHATVIRNRGGSTPFTGTTRHLRFDFPSLYFQN